MSTRRVRRAFLFVALALALVGVDPQPVFACFCKPLALPKAELCAMTGVYSGRIEHVEGPVASDPVRLVIKVDRVWKGPLLKSINIRTNGAGSSCDFAFETGKEYLVYGGMQDNELGVSVCSRTMLLTYAGDDIAELGLGYRPVLDSPDAPSGPPAATGWILQTVGLTGIAIAVGIGLRLRKWRR
jgi:hypothetical protein